MLVTLLTLPLAPVRGLAAVVKLLREQAERELHDPATAARQLEALDEAAAAGEISGPQLAEAQQEVLDRLSA